MTDRYASSRDLPLLFINEIRIIHLALHQFTALRNVLSELKVRNRRREKNGIQVDVISAGKIFDRIISFPRPISFVDLRIPTLKTSTIVSLKTEVEGVERERDARLPRNLNKQRLTY